MCVPVSLLSVKTVLQIRLFINNRNIFLVVLEADIKDAGALGELPTQTIGFTIVTHTIVPHYSGKGEGSLWPIS